MSSGCIAASSHGTKGLRSLPYRASVKTPPYGIIATITARWHGQGDKAALLGPSGRRRRRTRRRSLRLLYGLTITSSPMYPPGTLVRPTTVGGSSTPARTQPTPASASRHLMGLPPPTGPSWSSSTPPPKMTAPLSGILLRTGAPLLEPGHTAPAQPISVAWTRR